MTQNPIEVMPFYQLEEIVRLVNYIDGVLKEMTTEEKPIIKPIESQELSHLQR